MWYSGLLMPLAKYSLLTEKGVGLAGFVVWVVVVGVAVSCSAPLTVKPTTEQNELGFFCT